MTILCPKEMLRAEVFINTTYKPGEMCISRYAALLFFYEKEIFIMMSFLKKLINKADMKEGSVMGKKKRSFMKQVIVPAFFGAVAAFNLMGTTAFAAGTEAVTKPLDSLKTLIIAVIGAIGVIILAKNVMEFAKAYQQQDSSTMNSALKGIVAGVMMAGISSVLTFRGF